MINTIVFYVVRSSAGILLTLYSWRNIQHMHGLKIRPVVGYSQLIVSSKKGFVSC